MLSYTHKNSLQVLHIRVGGSDNARPIEWTNGRIGLGEDNIWSPDLLKERQDLVEELDEFAQWAFGPSGISSLRIIAFGDFYQQCRFKRSNALICRSTSKSRNYCPISPD